VDDRIHLKVPWLGLVPGDDRHGNLRGDALGVLGIRDEPEPAHGRTIINLNDAYYVTCDGKPEAIWPIAGRGCER
jgi:hypothetical protein